MNHGLKLVLPGFRWKSSALFSANAQQLANRLSDNPAMIDDPLILFRHPKSVLSESTAQILMADPIVFCSNNVCLTSKMRE
jgi:hypothetical protein